MTKRSARAAKKLSDDLSPAERRAAGIAKLRRSGITPGNPGNSGGKKGRSGRKPDAWKALCARLVNRDSTIRAAKRILRNPKHPAYLGAVKFFAEQAYGKAKEHHEVSGKLTLEQLLTKSREETDA